MDHWRRRNQLPTGEGAVHSGRFWKNREANSLAATTIFTITCIAKQISLQTRALKTRIITIKQETKDRFHQQVETLNVQTFWKRGNNSKAHYMMFHNFKVLRSLCVKNQTWPQLTIILVLLQLCKYCISLKTFPDMWAEDVQQISTR